MYSKEELKQLKTEFWESFSAYCDVQPFLKHRKRMWMLHRTKVRGVELKFDICRNNVFVVLEVNHTDENERIEMFEKLSWYKDIIECGFDEKPVWDVCYVRKAGNQVARIYLEKRGLDFHRRSDWGQIFSFMAINMYKLEKNLMSIADYLKE